MIPEDAACLETQGLSDEEKRAYWRGRMSVQVMDAAERADAILEGQYQNPESVADYTDFDLTDDERVVRLKFVAEHIRQAEQAARQDERRKVLEEAARLVEVKGEEERLLGDKFAADWRATKFGMMVEFATEEDGEKAHLGLMKEKQYEVGLWSREIGRAIRALMDKP